MGSNPVPKSCFPHVHSNGLENACWGASEQFLYAEMVPHAAERLQCQEYQLQEVGVLETIEVYRVEQELLCL